MTIKFEFKNLRASTKEWGSAYHVDCDIFVNDEFVTTYTYNPWWKIEDKKLIKKLSGWGAYDHNYNLFFGQHIFGRKLADWAVKKIRDEILKNLEGKFPAEIQPERADVIDCLVCESEALDYSFQDWCDNCEYDSDSISALETYNECCKMGRKLIKMGIWNEIKTECEKLREEGVL